MLSNSVVNVQNACLKKTHTKNSILKETDLILLWSRWLLRTERMGGGEKGGGVGRLIILLKMRGLKHTNG